MSAIPKFLRPLRVHWRLTLTGATVAASVVLPLSGAIDSSASPTTSGVAESQIVGLALNVAAANGDPSPASVQHTSGPRSQAVLVSSGETVPGDGQSYLIVERGHFVGTTVSRPMGMPAPTGTVLTVVVDAATGQVTDLGIQDNVPNLAALGTVTNDR